MNATTRRTFLANTLLATTGTLIVNNATGAATDSVSASVSGPPPSVSDKIESDLFKLLVPQPRQLTARRGSLRLSGRIPILVPFNRLHDLEIPLLQLSELLKQVCGFVPAFVTAGVDPTEKALRFLWDAALGPEAYVLLVGEEGIELKAGSLNGWYYGVQTLRQLLRLHGNLLPCLLIQDEPAYKARGFYHDVTRGKVPTRETLLRLIEQAAHLKLNQVQLYIEHSFVFRRHPDLSHGTDGLTSEDILLLDAHARRHHIELVPSLACFGHLYTLLTAPLKADLGEMPDDYSTWPFSWWDRMMHGTLNPKDPRALKLMRELLAEFLPLFSSTRFNLCGDETFDLGKGRNKSEAAVTGTGRLYVDFVKQLCAAASDQGKTVMMWADIVQHHPELIDELPSDLIFLDYDYDAGLPNSRLNTLRRQGKAFYVCPGVHAWRGFLTNMDKAWLNNIEYAKRGLEAGAIGMINTNWGDCGHVAGWAQPSFGFYLGAACAWNHSKTEALGEGAMGKTWSYWMLGDASGESAVLLREAGLCQKVDWWTLMFFQIRSNSVPDAWFKGPVRGVRLPDTILRLPSDSWGHDYQRLLEIAGRLRSLSLKARTADDLAWRELSIACEASALSIATAAVIQRAGGQSVSGLAEKGSTIAAAWRNVEPQLGELWHARNRPSEYFRVRQAILDIAANLERLEP